MPLAPNPAMPARLFAAQGHVRPDLLPAFVGFETAIHFDDVGMVSGLL